jgi:hypothetical protein
MIRGTRSGSALVVGLILLSLVSLLSLAGAAAAQIELRLARNELFRENAASAASAGIESAISRIVSSITPENATVEGSIPELAARFDASIRFVGYEQGLPQEPGANLAGAHFEITSTGHSSRRAFDRQRAMVRLAVSSPSPASATDCEPVAPEIPCVSAGELLRLSWQRLSRP